MSAHEVIGEGAFGCVHKPSLLCKDKKISYKNKIFRLQESNLSAHTTVKKTGILLLLFDKKIKTTNYYMEI